MELKLSETRCDDAWQSEQTIRFDFIDDDFSIIHPLPPVFGYVF